MTPASRRYTCPACGHKGRTHNLNREPVMRCAGCGSTIDRVKGEVVLMRDRTRKEWYEDID
jgi:DNA-directed RNA polymerase subunit RPC12/RpoP